MSAGGAYDAVLSAGIAGGFADVVAPGATVVGTASIAADLGAETPDGFLTLDDLGFGSSTVECDAALVGRLRTALPAAMAGGMLSVSTVTGTAGPGGHLRTRYPDAVAEGMEGFGVAAAAAAAGMPVRGTAHHLQPGRAARPGRLAHPRRPRRPRGRGLRPGPRLAGDPSYTETVTGPFLYRNRST